jgi:hypothetical protein
MTKLLILFAALALQVAASQQPNDRGSIHGVVVSVSSGKPLANASVELTHIENGKVVSRTGSSDSNGAFSFRDLPPGSGYQLVATGSNLQPTAHGQRSASDPWVPITLAPGERLDGVRITARALTSINGRVEDQKGQPLIGAAVALMKPEWVNGRRVIQSWASTVTDTRGAYRFVALPLGPYYLRIMPRNSESAQTLMANPGLQDFSPSDRPKNEPEGYPVVYFPVTDVTAAQVIHIGDGSAFDVPPIRVAKVRTSRIRGAVLHRATGKVVSGAHVLMVPADGPPDSNWTRSFESKNGQFDLRGVRPGSYSLTANAAEDGVPLSGRMQIHVREGETQTADLPVSPRLSIAGRITVEGWNGTGDPDFSQLTVRLSPDMTAPLDGSFQSIPVEPPPVLASVTEGGTFTLKNVALSDYRLTFSEPMSMRGAYLKSIRVGEKDLLRKSFRIDGPVTEPIEIVLGVDSGGLDGRIINSDRDSVPLARAILVPDDRSRRDLYMAVLSTNTGRFQFRDLAPGDYKVFAWRYVSPGAWMDPDFLQPYEDLGTRVRIAEGIPEYIEVGLISQ